MNCDFQVVSACSPLADSIPQGTPKGHQIVGSECHPKERSVGCLNHMSPQDKPRILFLNRSYWPDSEATGQLLTELCESLADEFDVHVLAGQPNAASEENWRDEPVRNGVTIHRVSHTVLPKSNMLLKAVNFVSFAAACRRQIMKLPTPDIVIFETDPFLLPFVADRLHRKSGVPMIGYLQDIYPDVAIALGKVKNSWFIRKLRQKMFDVYKRCERMVVLSTDMKQLLLDSQIDGGKIHVIPNWANTETIYPVPHEKNVFLERHNLLGKFVVMYSGNLGLTQRLEEFIEAAALLQHDLEIQFVFIGRGARKKTLQSQAESLGLSNVLFLDYQPKAELAHSLSAAELHLVPLTEELSRCLMPSKLYGILAAGRPYITNAPDESELHQITCSQQVGLTIKPGLPIAIAEKISEAKLDRQTLTAMGKRCRLLAEAKFTRKHATTAFKNVLFETLNIHEKLAC